MSMIYCQQCGKQMDQSALYCWACGAPSQQWVAASSSNNPFFWLRRGVTNYARFKGRARRKEFWMFELTAVIICMVSLIAFTLVIIGASNFSSNGLSHILDQPGFGHFIVLICLLPGIALLLGAVFLLPAIAVAVRRLHDINRSGWWLIAPLVFCLLPLFFYIPSVFYYTAQHLGLMLVFTFTELIFAVAQVAAIVSLLILSCLRGTHGDNRFGPDPKAVK